LRFSEPNWWEQSGIFAGLNTNKKSVTLDLGTEAGREVLRALVATCDVLVENFTPRVLDQLGLDWERARAIKPDLVMVRMPGFGLDGPWRDKPAFAFIIEDAAGLTWLTGHPDANPVSPYCVGDSNAGLHALVGLLHALEHRRRTGDGVQVEAAMVDAALSISRDQIVEYASTGRLRERNGNRGGGDVLLQNLYATADDGQDTWAAISVVDDGQLRALAGAIGDDATDERVAAWCATRGGDEIVKCLWEAGVPVAKVTQPHHQPELTQLQARRFFETVDHPVTGPARHSTLPFRLSSRTEPFHARHAPLLGEHNGEVLREIGLSVEHIAKLEADGVIGREPVR
jgi:crotonobetainyl-CoA:carnitine CoA-transferase CaiB-like acyl-CoA transferase